MNIINLQSIFSFCLCESEKVKTDLPKAFEATQSIGGYTLCADSRTPLQYAEINGRELIIFGYAVDVFSGQREGLAEAVLKSTEKFADVIEYERKLGGKYVIFYAENNACYCMGDATCSIPIFYTTGLSSFMCGCTQKMITDNFKLKPDVGLQKIRDSGPLNQAMPFDVTPYREIKQLIPNHYLDIGNQKAVRFFNSNEKQKEISPKKAAEITAPMIENITKMYLSEFKIYCPLTSGRDSRVVYVFLNKLAGEKVHSYTVWQENFKKDSQDWDVPVSLAKLKDAPHEQIYQDENTEVYRNSINEMLGENGYPDAAFKLAVTLHNHYGDGAVCEGDIIGQIGKCSLHRNIPLILASSGYFRCKLHNYSTEAKKLLQAWMKEIKASDEKTNMFDLFSVENRLGRWAPQTHQIHNAIGQTYINIFNSRSIIYTWTAVDRSKRMKSLIHVEFIKIIAPELLDIPFERDKSGLVNFAKSNAIIFYFASYMKFFVQRILFKLKSK